MARQGAAHAAMQEETQMIAVERGGALETVSRRRLAGRQAKPEAPAQTWVGLRPAFALSSLTDWTWTKTFASNACDNLLILMQNTPIIPTNCNDADQGARSRLLVPRVYVYPSHIAECNQPGCIDYHGRHKASAPTARCIRLSFQRGSF